MLQRTRLRASGNRRRFAVGGAQAVRDRCRWPRPVVTHRGARVGMRGGPLARREAGPGVERGGDERVPQGVRADVLADAGAARDPADNAGGTVPVQPPPVRSDEQRPVGALAGRQVDGAGGARGERDGDDLASNDQGAVASLQAQVLDAAPVASDTRSR